MKYWLLFFGLLLSGLVACHRAPTANAGSGMAQGATGSGETTQQYAPPQNGEIGQVEKSEEAWNKELTELEYHVLREAGTERAFTGDLWDNKKEGVYTCRGCGLPLFSSKTKFKSGTGWPSFFQPLKPEFVLEKADEGYGMLRTEVLCARCGGHLGHVFEDGPKPTGLRYCMNSVSLDFIDEDKLDQ